MMARRRLCVTALSTETILRHQRRSKPLEFGRQRAARWMADIDDEKQMEDRMLKRLSKASTVHRSGLASSR